MLQIKTDLYRYVHYTSNVAVCNYQEIIGCDVSFMVVLISERHGGLFYIPYESCSIPIVTSILDIQYEYYPESFTSDLLQYRRNETKKALINSAAIITISEFSKKTMLDKLGADEEKIYVTYLNERGYIPRRLRRKKLFE